MRITMEVTLNKEGTKMDKDGKDLLGLWMTSWKNVAQNNLSECTNREVAL